MKIETWRKRVGVEPTIRLAKSRINGFEGHEDHRAPFASLPCKNFRLRDLLNVFKTSRFRNPLLCYWSVGWASDSCHDFMQIGDRQVPVPLLRHPRIGRIYCR